VTDIGGPYADLEALKHRLDIPDDNTDHDTDLESSLIAASGTVNHFCGRQFGKTESATERRFRAGRRGVDVDDFWTADGLIVTPWANGAAGTSWTADYEFELEPPDGVVDGVPGWPFNRLTYSTFGTWTFYGVAHVRVTAKWGWADVPGPVRSATLMLAAMDWKSADAPFGYAAFGDYAARIRGNPMAQALLAPYQTYDARLQAAVGS